MSGHRRVRVAATFLVAGLSLSPAWSDPLSDLFKPAGKEATAPAPAPAPEECVSQPGKSTEPGQHWVYHRDGHRKCWFEAQVPVSVQKHVRHRAAKRRQDKEPVLPKMASLNAQDKLLAVPPSQVTEDPAATDTAPAAGGQPATLGSAELLSAEPTSDRLTTDGAHPDGNTNTNTNTELSGMVLPVTSLDSDGRASSPPEITAARPSVPDDDKDDWQPMATRLGMVGIALGLLLLIGSLLATRLLNSGRDKSADAKRSDVAPAGQRPYRDRTSPHRSFGSPI